MPLPNRRILGHTPPPFFSDGALFFLTICTTPRGRNQLATAEAWSLVTSATAAYDKNARWFVRLLLAMPDHLHILVAFPSLERSATVVHSWKHYLAHRAGIEWQRGFFDHRLRSTEELDEKSHYIRMNPVRAGLIENADAWPYRWQPDDCTTFKP